MIKESKSKLVHEIAGDEPYEYYPLGEYVVRAPGICGGRPTFKYTRVEVGFILGRIANGKSIDDIVEAYDDLHISREAIYEAMGLANMAFLTSPTVTDPLAV